MKESKNHKSQIARHLLPAALLVMTFIKSYSQVEIEPWGNITGIRVEGQLMKFESSLRVVGKDWSQVSTTARERQRPKYVREGGTQIVTTHLDSLYFTENVRDAGSGIAEIDIKLTARADTDITGAFLCIVIPSREFATAKVQLVGTNEISLSAIEAGQRDQQLSFPAKGVKFTAPQHELEIGFSEPAPVIIRNEIEKNDPNVVHTYIPLHLGKLKNGEIIERVFTIKVAGEIDRKPVELVLNTTEVGSSFDGFGGNFRLQNPKMDPQVIDYCLQNLRVAWARVEMPWMFWQPDKNSNPLDSAKAGKTNPRVLQAMDMARRLGKMNIPIILSAWFPPKWAIVGEPNFRPRPDGVWGNPLDRGNMPEIFKSIADYIFYLKKEYGVDIKLFSFNESDLGINVRQTGEEHAELIKGLGAYFVSRGLKTKLLLGDNSDANSFAFIVPAMMDPATRPYIGAISFHSWRGWEKETLQKWADAAKKMNLPLIVGEGSIDAAAWNYPAVFQEQTYALEEINLYIRILAICQPVSILQWQLTSDYSPLAGGGIFGNNEPLRPTQRFWNLKQLASVPKGLHAMQVTGNAEDISCAALGDNKKNIYSIHLVNNGATRAITLSGLPKRLTSFRVTITAKGRDMEQGESVRVINGTARFTLLNQSYTELESK